MGFWIKKAITAMILPVPLACALVLVGLCLLRAWPRLAKGMILLGPLYLLLLSFSPVTTWLAESLEQQYPVWQPGEPVDYVVVLGSGHHVKDKRPPWQVLSPTALSRLMEGYRVWQANPAATLVVSGYAGDEPQSHADSLAQAAVALGVPAQQILRLPQAMDTLEEARQGKALLGDSPAVLVTSATHLVRAMEIYQSEGLNVTAAPADFTDNPTRPWYLSAENLWKSQRVLHEYIGRTWLRLRGVV